MSDPVIIRVSRPYQSVDEYLQAEAWTIDARGMFLIDAPSLARNTPVRFVVAIANGEQLIRAEGVARDYVPASSRAAGGLRVWFKRFGVATKEIIDRAVAIKAKQAAAAVAGRMALAPTTQSTADFPQVIVADLPSSPKTSPGVDPKPRSEPPRAVSGGERKKARAASGSLAPPTNREELLERLRGRAEGKSLDEVLAKAKH